MLLGVVDGRKPVTKNTSEPDRALPDNVQLLFHGQFCRVCSAHRAEPERENAAATTSFGVDQLPTLRLCQRFGDGEAEAGTVYSIRGGRVTIEGLEDSLGVHPWNAGTAIRYTQLQPITNASGGQNDRRSRRRIDQCVVEEIHKHSERFHEIEHADEHRCCVVDLHTYAIGAIRSGHFEHCSAHEILGRIELDAHRELARIQTRHVEQMGYHLAQPFGLCNDDDSVRIAGIRRILRERLDAGERSAKVVRYRGEEYILETRGFTQCFRVACFVRQSLDLFGARACLGGFFLCTYEQIRRGSGRGEECRKNHGVDRFGERESVEGRLEVIRYENRRRGRERESEWTAAAQAAAQYDEEVDEDDVCLALLSLASQVHDDRYKYQ